MKTMNKGLSSLLSITLLAGTSLGLQRCTAEEVATTIGVIAIGAGAIAIGVAAGSDDHNNCRGGSRQVCRDYRDYYGRWQRECHTEYRNGCRDDRWDRHAPLASGMMSSSVDVASIGRVNTILGSTGDLSQVDAQDAQFQNNWADHFAMSAEGAKTLLDGLTQAKAGHLQALYDLGLSKKDLKKLAQLKMISDEGLQALAQKLNQDVGATRDMLEQILEHAQTYKDRLPQTGDNA